MTERGGRGKRRGSGFISRNNDDPTAEATFHFMKTAGLSREQTISWNVVPWWNGTRVVTSRELNQGLERLKELITYLPRLRTVILVGAKAGKGREAAAMSKKQKRYLNDPWQTAIHEAGHAVIGRVLGMVCGHTTIIPNEAEGEAGHSITAVPTMVWYECEKQYFAQLKRGLRPLKYRDYGPVLRGRIITCMAGAEAEHVLLGGSPGGDDDDRYQIALMAESRWAFSSDEEWQRYEPRMRRQARRLIRKHRDKIERMAEGLLQRKSLTPEDDQLILGECSR